MKYSLLMLLACAVAGLGQPVEGPWVVMETDSGTSIHTPQIVVCDSVTVEISCTEREPEVRRFWVLPYDLHFQALTDLIEPYETSADTLTVVDVKRSATETARIFWESWGDSVNAKIIRNHGQEWHSSLLDAGHFFGGWSGSYDYRRPIELSLQEFSDIWGAAWTVYWENSIGWCVQIGWFPVIAIVDTIGSVHASESALSWGDNLSTVIYPHITQLSESMYLLFGGNFGLRTQPLAYNEGVWSWMSPTDIPWNGSTQYAEMTQGGRWLLYAPADAWNPTRVLQIHFGDGCELLCSLEITGSPADVAWHSDYGFAALYASPNALELVRVDTNGVQTLPTGTIMWRDSMHTFADASVVITDSGTIVVVWTEKRIDEPAARRLMLTTVGWLTPLEANPEPYRTAVRGYQLDAYPNPFNPTTTISFELPRDGQVTLEVYDLMGRLVQTLVNESMTAGAHRITFDASHLSSGIYWSRLNAGGTQVVRKMVLLR